MCFGFRSICSAIYFASAACCMWCLCLPAKATGIAITFAFDVAYICYLQIIISVNLLTTFAHQILYKKAEWLGTFISISVVNSARIEQAFKINTGRPRVIRCHNQLIPVDVPNARQQQWPREADSPLGDGRLYIVDYERIEYETDLSVG